MVLSGAEYSMAVIAAFPLSLVAILSSGPFSVNIDILGFSQNCSYTTLALSFRSTLRMPRTESSSAISQDYLDFYYTSSAISFLGSGLGPQCKNGLGPQIIGPHKALNDFLFFFSFSTTKKLLCFYVFFKNKKNQIKLYTNIKIKDALFILKFLLNN